MEKKAQKDKQCEQAVYQVGHLLGVHFLCLFFFFSHFHFPLGGEIAHCNSASNAFTQHKNLNTFKLPLKSTVFVCPTDFCAEYLNRKEVRHVWMWCVWQEIYASVCLLIQQICRFRQNSTRCHSLIMLGCRGRQTKNVCHLLPNETMNSQDYRWQNKMCRLPSCPKPPQTILEDEVDDPVYQVGPWTHRSGSQSLPTSTLFFELHWRCF